MKLRYHPRQYSRVFQFHNIDESQAKRLSYEEKKEKLLVDLINKMFEIAGHNVTFEDIKDRKDDWYNQWTMTEDQYNQWRKWGSKEIKIHIVTGKHYDQL